jgi:DNA recombination protein RmuC
MISLFGQTYPWTAPEVLVPSGMVLLLILVVLLTYRGLRPSPLMLQEMAWLSQRVQGLAEGQERLSGGLTRVSESQVHAQTAMLHLMEARLADVQKGMTEVLQGTSIRTARSLGDLHQRLETIDKAQANIEKLSGNVLSLQDILSNKQTRGAFGEIQLHDIVSKALPPDSYTMQATLPNGRRADCLIHLPKPPGPIVIDAKFPLEAYEALRRADTPRAAQDAAAAFRTSVRLHLRAIADRYILDGETAEGALMFLPSEAVYAELHANYPEVVREGFGLRVWIVSPTTCMATLNTFRAVLKDVRMKAQTGAIRRELAELSKDIDRLSERVGNLDRHFTQASRDVEEIRLSADKAGKRARRLDNFDFEEPQP